MWRDGLTFCSLSSASGRRLGCIYPLLLAWMQAHTSVRACVCVDVCFIALCCVLGWICYCCRLPWELHIHHFEELSNLSKVAALSVGTVVHTVFENGRGKMGEGICFLIHALFGR